MSTAGDFERLSAFPHAPSASPSHRPSRTAAVRVVFAVRVAFPLTAVGAMGFESSNPPFGAGGPVVLAAVAVDGDGGGGGGSGDVGVGVVTAVRVGPFSSDPSVAMGVAAAAAAVAVWGQGL